MTELDRDEKDYVENDVIDTCLQKCARSIRPGSKFSRDRAIKVYLFVIATEWQRVANQIQIIAF